MLKNYFQSFTKPIVNTKVLHYNMEGDKSVHYQNVTNFF
jgi:hypothetical protein